MPVEKVVIFCTSSETAVARGDVQIGFQQISEILPIEGADYVGPIPVAGGENP